MYECEKRTNRITTTENSITMFYTLTCDGLAHSLHHMKDVYCSLVIILWMNFVFLYFFLHLMGTNNIRTAVYVSKTKREKKNCDDNNCLNKSRQRINVFDARIIISRKRNILRDCHAVVVIRFDVRISFQLSVLSVCLLMLSLLLCVSMRVNLSFLIRSILTVDTSFILKCSTMLLLLHSVFFFFILLIFSGFISLLRFYPISKSVVVAYDSKMVNGLFERIAASHSILMRFSRIFFFFLLFVN